MSALVPQISWKRFFGRLTPVGQRSLERALADGGLLLGEYMELVERAYLQAYLLRENTPSRHGDLVMDAQVMAESLVRSYAARKREWILKTAAYRAAASQSAVRPPEAIEGMTVDLPPLPDTLSPYRKMRLRRRIHVRIEAMKRECI